MVGPMRVRTGLGGLGLFRSMVLVLATVLASATVLVGCGSPPPLVSVPRVTVTTRTLRSLPPGQAPPPSAPASPGPTVVIDPGASPPATTAGGPPADPSTSAGFCAQVRRYTDVVNQLNASPSTAQLRQLVIDVTASIEAAAALAPTPVKADVTLMAGAHRRFLTALQQADFDPAQLAPGAGADLQSAPYLAARTRVRDFNRRNCT